MPKRGDMVFIQIWIKLMTHKPKFQSNNNNKIKYATLLKGHIVLTSK